MGSISRDLSPTDWDFQFFHNPKLVRVTYSTQFMDRFQIEVKESFMIPTWCDTKPEISKMVIYKTSRIFYQTW